MLSKKPADSGTLTLLQTGRGVAACLVLLFHATGAVESPLYWNYPVLGGAFHFGFSGVEFFFVLSGFIIYWAHERDMGRPEQLSKYAWRRFARIYPNYWVVLALVTPVLLFWTGTNQKYNITLLNVFESFVLVGNPESTILTVAWTLFHEVLFYAAFALLVINRRLGSWVIGIWFGLSLVDTAGGNWLGYFGSALHLLFGFGMLAAWLLRNRTIHGETAWLAVSVLAFLLVGACLDAGWI